MSSDYLVGGVHESMRFRAPLTAEQRDWLADVFDAWVLQTEVHRQGLLKSKEERLKRQQIEHARKLEIEALFTEPTMLFTAFQSWRIWVAAQRRTRAEARSRSAAAMVRSSGPKKQKISGDYSVLKRLRTGEGVGLGVPDAATRRRGPRVNDVATGSPISFAGNGNVSHITGLPLTTINLERWKNSCARGKMPLSARVPAPAPVSPRLPPRATSASARPAKRAPAALRVTCDRRTDVQMRAAAASEAAPSITRKSRPVGRSTVCARKNGATGPSPYAIVQTLRPSPPQKPRRSGQYSAAAARRRKTMPANEPNYGHKEGEQSCSNVRPKENCGKNLPPALLLPPPASPPLPSPSRGPSPQSELPGHKSPVENEDIIAFNQNASALQRLQLKAAALLQQEAHMPTKTTSTSIGDLQAAEGQDLQAAKVQDKVQVDIGQVADLKDEDDRLLPTQQMKQLAMDNVAFTTNDKGVSESGGRHAFFSGDSADDGRLQQFVEVAQARAGQVGDTMGIMFINISPHSAAEPTQNADDDSAMPPKTPALGAKSVAVRDKAGLAAEVGESTSAQFNTEHEYSKTLQFQRRQILKQQLDLLALRQKGRRESTKPKQEGIDKARAFHMKSTELKHGGLHARIAAQDLSHFICATQAQVRGTKQVAAQVVELGGNTARSGRRRRRNTQSKSVVPVRLSRGLKARVKCRQCHDNRKEKTRATFGIADTDLGEAEEAYMRHVSQELRRAKADLARENERERQRRRTKQRSRAATEVSTAHIMPERPSNRRQTRHAPVPYQRMKRLRPKRAKARLSTVLQTAHNHNGRNAAADNANEVEAAEDRSMDHNKAKGAENQLPIRQSDKVFVEPTALSVSPVADISSDKYSYENAAAGTLSSRPNAVESTEIYVNERTDMSIEDKHSGDEMADIHDMLVSAQTTRSTVEEDSEEERDTRDELDRAWAEAVAMLGPGEAAALLGMDENESQEQEHSNAAAQVAPEREPHSLADVKAPKLIDEDAQSVEQGHQQAPTTESWGSDSLWQQQALGQGWGKEMPVSPPRTPPLPAL